MSKPKQEDIAIIGLSCLYPGARSPLELWENVLAKRQQFRQIPENRLPLGDYHDPNRKAADKTYGREAALIDGFQFDWTDHRIPKKTFESTDIVHWLALHVALLAMEDAGYSKDSITREKCGVILGNTLTGEWTRSNAMRMRWPFIEKVLRQSAKAKQLSGRDFEDFLASSEQAFKSVFPETNEDTLAGALSNTIAGRICNVLDLHGGGYTVDGACSSSLIAVIQAARGLANHDLDMAFAGGIDISLDTFELIGFAKTGALSPDQMRVYDKRANGFIPGEGCGFVVLKRLSDAKRDGDQVYAVLKGWALSSDGKGGLTAPSVSGQVEALSRAYDMAGYPLSSCHFVEGHGTGTPLGDKVEISAISQASKEGKIGLTSLKSIVGHTKAAAGIGALIKAVIAVNRRVLPPLAACDLPNELFQKEAKHLYPLIEGEICDPSIKLRAGVSAMGFGGINSHVTLEAGDDQAEKFCSELNESQLLASHENFEIFPISAPSLLELRNQIEENLTSALTMSRAEMVDLAADCARKVKPNDSWKGAVVAEHALDLCQRLNELLELCKQEIEPGQWLASERVTLSYKLSQPRIAFLYPGQGSQQINMGRQLIERHEWAKEDAQLFEQKLSQICQQTFFDTYQIPNAHRLSSEDLAALKKTAAATDLAQASICLVSSLWHQKMHKIGLSPQTVAGHSLGELTALWAAGAISKDELADLASWRGHFMAHSGTEIGKMAYLLCDQHQAQSLIDQTSHYVAIANINSARQTIVSGKADGIQELLEAAKKAGVDARELNVSNAFHSQLMNQAASDFADKLRGLGKRPLKIAMRSGIDSSILESQIDLSEYLPKQITSQVNYKELAEKILAEHDLVVELGPGRVLTGLNQNLKPQGQLALHCVADGSPSSLECKRLLASAFTMGVKLRWDEIYADRLVRVFTKAKDLRFIENPCERPLNIDGELIQVKSKEVAPDVIPAEKEELSIQTAAPEAATSNAVQSTTDISALIVSEVHTLTGFDPSTISMDLRVLDDLNMDSIKAGELIAAVAVKLGLAGQVEFAEYVNASLGEIATHFATLSSQSSTIDVGVVPTESQERVEAITKPLPQQHAAANILSHKIRTPWVRTMVENFEIKPIANSHVNWPGLRVGIIYDPSQENLAYAMADHLENQNSEPHLHLLDEAALLQNLARQAYQHVLIVPKTNYQEITSSTISKLVEQLGTIAKFPKTHANQSISVLHFDEGPFSRDADNPEFSLKAWLSSLAAERTDLKLRALSFDKDIPIAKVLGHTLAQADREEQYLASYVNAQGENHEPTLCIVEPKDMSPRAVHLNKDDIVLVAGGAKGITALCGLETAKRYACKMILLGSSPASSNSELSTIIEQYHSFGLTAHYYQCNLTEADQVTSCIEMIRRDHGEPTAVIYGAGVNKPNLAHLVKSEQAEHELAVKILGAQNLFDQLDTSRIRLLVILTSVIGVTGMPGNSWYALANESLDLITRRFKSKAHQAHTVSLAYSVWSEIGMGAKLGSVERLEEKGISSIDPKKGVQRFLHAIQYAASDHQQIIVSRLGDLGSTSSQVDHQNFKDWRFLGQALAHQEQIERVTRLRLSLEDDPYLIDHNYKGSYLFPTVFGLEAMAQNALLLCGQDSFDELSIEDIQLTKPITVGSEGCELLIWTEVMERVQQGEPLTIRAGIRCEKTGYRSDHFSAVFKFTQSAQEEFITFDRSARPLGIDPKTDLYDSILFQGPRFQRLKEIFYLESDDENEGMSIFHAVHENEQRPLMILGDAYFRDSLLQSAQLIIPRYQCLPVAISSLKIRRAAIQDRSKRYCLTEVHRVDEKRFNASVTVVNADGKVLEHMEDYTLQLIKKMPDMPSASQLIDVKKANTMNFRGQLSELGTQIGEQVPEIAVIPKSDQDARQIFHAELRRFAKTHDLDLPHDLPELKAGSSVLAGAQARIFTYVYEHEDEFICTLSCKANMAIDLQILNANWQARHSLGLGLISSTPELSGSGKLDQARRDGILELVQSLGLEEYEISSSEFIGKADIMVKIKAPGLELNLLSCQVLNGHERIYTLVYDIKDQASKKLLAPYQKLADILRIDAEAHGPQEQAVFVHSFIPDFKAFANLGRSIYFSQFFNWMGVARELSSAPVLDRIRKLTESGRWGLVTNWASIRVLGECRNKDRIVQARMWCGKITGAQQSSVTLSFDWISLGEDGIEERIATGEMGFTWVEILGHGLVKPAPFPDYYRDFIDSMIAKTDAPNRYLPAPEPLADLKAGDIVFEALQGPRGRPQLIEKCFETSLFDANLVGNLYFGNYSIWMGKTRDYYFQKLMPDRYRGIGELGEFRCTDCTIQHLREAMPFDNIKVVMSVSKVHRQGLDLYFEFFKVNEGGSDEKLAYGDHKIVWTMAHDKKVRAADLPDELMDELLRVIEVSGARGVG